MSDQRTPRQGVLPDHGTTAKGYTAEPGPLPHVPPEGPLPVASVSDPPPAIHVPERDGHVQPTGRDEPGEYTPNDRLMGADR